MRVNRLQIYTEEVVHDRVNYCGYTKPKNRHSEERVRGLEREGWGESAGEGG